MGKITVVSGKMLELGNLVYVPTESNDKEKRF